MTGRDGIVLVRQACWPADAEVASTLLHGYQAFLSTHTPAVAVGKLNSELAEGVERWSPPLRIMLLAFVAGQPAGCVCLLDRPGRVPSAWELKRLWVQHSLRGSGVGRALLASAIAYCREHGAAELLLDTLPLAMPRAVALYRSAGFVETERHNESNIPGLLFMKLELSIGP